MLNEAEISDFIKNPEVFAGDRGDWGDNAGVVRLPVRASLGDTGDFCQPANKKRLCRLRDRTLTPIYLPLPNTLSTLLGRLPMPAVRLPSKGSSNPAWPVNRYSAPHHC